MLMKTKRDPEVPNKPENAAGVGIILKGPRMCHGYDSDSGYKSLHAIPAICSKCNSHVSPNQDLVCTLWSNTRRSSLHTSVPLPGILAIHFFRFKPLQGLLAKNTLPASLPPQVQLLFNQPTASCSTGILWRLWLWICNTAGTMEHLTQKYNASLPSPSGQNLKWTPRDMAELAKLHLQQEQPFNQIAVARAALAIFPWWTVHGIREVLQKDVYKKLIEEHKRWTTPPEGQKLEESELRPSIKPIPPAFHHDKSISLTQISVNLHGMFDTTDSPMWFCDSVILAPSTQCPVHQLRNNSIWAAITNKAESCSEIFAAPI